MPVKETELDASFSNLYTGLDTHWTAFNLYNPEAEDQPEPELTSSFVDGSEAHQRRLGKAIKLRHESIFGEKV